MIGVKGIDIEPLTNQEGQRVREVMDDKTVGLVLALTAWSGIGLAVVKADGVRISLAFVAAQLLLLTITL